MTHLPTHPPTHLPTHYPRSIAEIEVMVAEEGCRRKGIGNEAVVLMMWWAVEKMGVKRFYCKINEENTASLGMFER